jgi:MFS family permease
MIAVLRQRNFSLLWFAGLISITGDWTLSVALPFYIYQTTGSALATGLMFMVRTLPGVVFGSIAGVFVDRWDRKWTMVAVNLFATFLVLLMLVVKSGTWLWVVYLVAFIESSVMQFFSPAEKALLPCLVVEKHLVSANALNALNGNLGMFIGSAIGGILMGLTGIASVIVFDCVSYLIAGMMIALITWSPVLIEKEGETTNLLLVWSDLRKEWFDGLKLVKQSRLITVIFTAAAIAMLGEGIIQALLVLFVNQLQGGAIEYGMLLTLRGLGGLLGGLIFGLIGKSIKPQRIFPWTLAGIGLLLLVMFNHPVLMIALITLCLTGLLAVGASVTSTTMLQESIHNTYLGRIFGLMGMITSLMILAGQGAAGGLTDRLGLAAMLNMGGWLYAASGLIALLLFGSCPARNDPMRR